jgi:hypothetical protein
MMHNLRNADVHLKRIFGLRLIFRPKDPFNALRAGKIISIYAVTRSFEHCP